jgi:L-lysine exporter family protein LysE/ArgO
MLLGSFGSQFAEELRPAFAAGPCWLPWSGSTDWRSGGGFSPWLARGRVQQAIDLVVGLIMLVLAAKLALGAISAS